MWSAPAHRVLSDACRRRLIFNPFVKLPGAVGWSVEVGLLVAEHGPQDVDAAAGEGEDGLAVASSRFRVSTVRARWVMSRAATSSPGNHVCCPVAAWARVASAAALRTLWARSHRWSSSRPIARM